jgi:hypothetical protein
MVLWNLLKGGPSHNGTLLRPSESIRGGTSGTNSHHESTTSDHSSRRDEEDDQDPLHTSVHLPRDTAMGIRGWPMHYPVVPPLGMGG